MASITPLLIKFGARCYYCGCNVVKSTPVSPWHPTTDHYMPKARGGDNSEENRVLCCSGCNSAKADMTGDEFFEFVRSRKLPASYIEYLTQKLWSRLESGAREAGMIKEAASP